MAVGKSSGIDKLRRCNEEAKAVELRRQEATQEAAMEMGLIVLNSGGIDVDRALLAKVVKRLAEDTDGSFIEALGLDVAKGKKAGRKQAGEAAQMAA